MNTVGRTKNNLSSSIIFYSCSTTTEIYFKAKFTELFNSPYSSEYNNTLNILRRSWTAVEKGKEVVPNSV